MKLFSVFKQAGKDWMGDHAMRLSAALSYYSVFSLAPLLLIAISIAGMIFGEEAARGAIEGQISGAIGQDAASAIEEMIEGAKTSGNNVFMTVVGVVVLLMSASGVFAQLKDAMNVVWEIEPKPGRGIWAVVKDRFLSLSMVLVIGFLLLVSLVLSAAMAAASSWLGGVVPMPELIGMLLSFVVSTAVVTVLFAMIFKILPDADVEWRDVWVGAFLTALLFAIGKLLLGWYLGRQDAASTYGAAGALILVLTWVYYSANILLFGAEFTQAYARARGRRIVPDKGARLMGEKEPKGAVESRGAEAGGNQAEEARRDQTGGDAVQGAAVGVGRERRVSRKQGLAETLIGGGMALLVQWLLEKMFGGNRRGAGVAGRRPSLLVYGGRYLQQAVERGPVTRERVESAVRAEGLGDVGEAYAVVLEESGEIVVIAGTGEPIGWVERLWAGRGAV